MSIAAAALGELGRHPLWGAAPDLLRRRLLSRGEHLALKPGENALEYGQPARRIFLLVDGLMRISLPPHGRRAGVTVKLLQAPAFFGEAESMLGAAWQETVEALTPTRLWSFESRHYFACMREHAETCFRHYCDTAARFGVSIGAHRAVLFDELQERTLAVFAAYAAHRGRPLAGSEAVLIDSRLTLDGLAREVGTNRRTLARVLAALYRSGAVTRRGRRFAVLPLAQLLGTLPTRPSMAYRIHGKMWPDALRSEAT
ncbi:MAG: Crp/Fnr family transcriptional regulator [Archangiaceae bacterium]|nr:Crp/Fnr family transcriptional regulator [Archangiaceae bacterium]